LITTQSYNQVSGQDELAAVLGRWNWGAFLLNWIWGIGNRCYFGLLTFVPLFGLVVPFVLGAKGNAWAWRTGQWQSVADFQRAQRRWARSALLVYAGVMVFAAAMISLIMVQLRRSEAFELAYAELSRSPQVAELLGAPLEVGIVTGSIKVEGGGSGETDLAFSLAGPSGKGKAYAHASKRTGAWGLQDLALVLEDGRRLELRERSVSAASEARAPAAPVEAPPPSAAEPPRLPVMRVHLAGEKTEVRGALSRPDVERALDAQRARLEPCLERLVGPSTLALKIVVSATGEVQRASVERARSVDAGARACVIEVARSFVFPAPARGSAVIKHTIAIGP
jgi:hypothetical protein